MVALGVVIGVRAWLTEPPRRVGVEETVERFRKASQESAPVDGVYVYDTKGSESVDVLGGDSHTYPAETALTVMAEACGLRMTWKPLDGRAESWLVCPAGGGLDVPTTSSVHSFFRQTYDTGFVCQGSWWVPPLGTTTWTSSCENTDRTATRTARVIGIEPYTIDGASRQAIHEEAIDNLSRVGGLGHHRDLDRSGNGTDAARAHRHRFTQRLGHRHRVLQGGPRPDAALPRAAALSERQPGIQSRSTGPPVHGGSTRSRQSVAKNASAISGVIES